jgi:hypothetical protein
MENQDDNFSAVTASLNIHIKMLKLKYALHILHNASGNDLLLLS